VDNGETKGYVSLIRNVVLPEGLTSIADGAFYNVGITTITIPSTVRTIGESAFECTGITSVIIPDGVTSISGSCFAFCENLQSITIPASVTSIEWDAFWRCNALADVYYSGTAAQRAQISIGSGNDPVLIATWHCLDGNVVPSTPAIGIFGDLENFQRDEATGKWVYQFTPDPDDFTGNMNFGEYPFSIIINGKDYGGEPQIFDHCYLFDSVINLPLERIPHSDEGFDDISPLFMAKPLTLVASHAGTYTFVLDLGQKTLTVTNDCTEDPYVFLAYKDWLNGDSEEAVLYVMGDVIGAINAGAGGEGWSTPTLAEVPTSDFGEETILWSTLHIMGGNNICFLIGNDGHTYGQLIVIEQLGVPVTLTAGERCIVTCSLPYEQWGVYDFYYGADSHKLEVKRRIVALTVIPLEITGYNNNNDPIYASLVMPEGYAVSIDPDGPLFGGETVTATAPQIPGYTFLGWYEETHEDNLECISSDFEHAVVVDGYGTDLWIVYEAADVPVTGVTVTPVTASVAVGGTQQLTAVVAPENATNPTVTWSSSDETIATVDGNGLVTAVAAGAATITAAAGDQTAACEVTVTEPEPEYDAFIGTMGGKFGDIQVIRYTFLVKNTFEDPTFALTVGGASRPQVTDEVSFYTSKWVCWWLHDGPTASTTYEGYTQYVIWVKLFARQYNTKTVFTITSNGELLRIKSFERLANGIVGTVDTSVSYSMTDLAGLYAILRPNGEAWAALQAAMGDFADKLNVVAATGN
jgi:hypothetical protein